MIILSADLGWSIDPWGGVSEGEGWANHLALCAASLDTIDHRPLQGQPQSQTYPALGSSGYLFVVLSP